MSILRVSETIRLEHDDDLPTVQVTVSHDEDDQLCIEVPEDSPARVSLVNLTGRDFSKK